MIKTTGNIAASANIVKESVVMGDVSIGADSTILFYAVLRGDDNKIVIGKGTNIQDNCTVHPHFQSRPDHGGRLCDGGA